MLGQQWRTCSLPLVRTHWQEGPLGGYCSQMACVRNGLWDVLECTDTGKACFEGKLEDLFTTGPWEWMFSRTLGTKTAEACSAFHINVNAYTYTLQSVTCMGHFGLEPKASSADLCKLKRQIDNAAPCDTVSCPHVSGVCFLWHWLRFHQIPHTGPGGLCF